jgi:hypothetical protein
MQTEALASQRNVARSSSREGAGTHLHRLVPFPLMTAGRKFGGFGYGPVLSSL